MGHTGLFDKVNVVHAYGQSTIRGYMKPGVNMVTNKGTIHTVDAGSGTCMVSVGDGNVRQRFYTNSLYVLHSRATGVDPQYGGYSTVTGAIVFSHTGVFPPPRGVPIGVGSGAAITAGNPVYYTSGN